MAAGFSSKEDRQAGHIANSYGGGARGLSIGYATINKRRGAGKKRKRARRRNR